jgi:hypothetical protein
MEMGFGNFYRIDFNMLNKLLVVISIPIANTKNPITFEMEFNPACPVRFITLGANEKIT